METLKSRSLEISSILQENVQILTYGDDRPYKWSPHVACIETSCMTPCSVYAKKPKSHYKAIIIIVIIIIIIIIICIQHILV